MLGPAARGTLIWNPHFPKSPEEPEIAGKWFKATNYSQDVGSKYSYEQSKLLLGNADTKKITINNSSKDLVSGLIVSGPGTERPDFAGSQMFVTTKNLVMNLHSDNSYVYGINAMNASDNRRDENSELIEGAKETVKLVINAEEALQKYPLTRR